MPTLTTSHGTLFYAQRGRSQAGLPVLCLHGGGGTHQHWAQQVTCLGRSWHTLALDLPGHGRSTGLGCTSIGDYSKVVVDFLDALGLHRVVLAGHSMGGAIALWLALTHPDRVAGVVLASTGARLHIMPAILDGLEHNPLEAVRLIVARAYDQYTTLSVLGAGESLFLQTDPLIFQRDLLACNAFDVRNDLHRVQCPALVLCGETDEMTPPRFSHYLHEHLSGSRLVLVPQAGHMLIVEQPDAVCIAIQGWLSDTFGA